jgi:hypothetical protein
LKIEVIANDAGDRVTPAVVAFSESETVSLIYVCSSSQTLMLQYYGKLMNR